MAKKTAIKDVEIESLNKSESTIKLNYKISAKCKNKRQKEFLNILKNEEKKICFGMGSAGSGKSYISLSYALSALKNKEYEQVVILIPTCQGGSKALQIGFLKGTLEEKYAPFQEADRFTIEKILKNSGNAEHKEISKQLINSDKIRYDLVNFARGKTYDSSLILINESENYSKEDMLLLLTRIGENSKIVITGDEKQIDRKDLGKSGMTYAYERLKDLEEVGMVEFTEEDIVRNPLISKILEKW